MSAATRGRFADRREAGRVLAARMWRYADRHDVVVLALPRGGVPVAFEVAARLGAPLDVFVVRKLGVPGQEELAMGALASGGELVLNREVIERLQIPDAAIARVARQEAEELARREAAYRGVRPPLEIGGRIAILVDDGLATGTKMRAAVRALAQRRAAPARVVVAAPVAAPSTCEELGRHVDEIVCVATPEPFEAVGLWYEDFTQTSDEEVRRLLAAGEALGGAPSTAL